MAIAPYSNSESKMKLLPTAGREQIVFARRSKDVENDKKNLRLCASARDKTVCLNYNWLLIAAMGRSYTSPNGILTVKVVPWPSVLSTRISP